MTEPPGYEALLLAVARRGERINLRQRTTLEALAPLGEVEYLKSGESTLEHAASLTVRYRLPDDRSTGIPMPRWLTVSVGTDGELEAEPATSETGANAVP